MITKLKHKCQGVVNKNKEKNATSILDAEYTEYNDPLFCEYQNRIVLDNSPVLICEKGRQIGYSHVTAFRAVYKAASNIRDTVYMSYNKESAKDFMRDVQRWCRIFNLGYMVHQQECINSNLINVFDCTFYNLRKIIAVSGDCTNLRGKPGADIVIDEAAYNMSSMEDVLAASMATLIHGGTVRIGSTHAGTESDFNKLVIKVKAGELPYQLMRVSFRDAVNQGLFKRICAKQKVEWSLELQNQWVDEIYQLYGIRATEELDAIPSDFGLEGKIFNTFQTAKPTVKYWEHLYFRYTDLAASEEITAFCTASVKVQYDLSTKKLIIVDWYAEHLSPLDGDRKIIDTAIKDGKDCYQIIEVEPGSSGIKYVEILKQELIKNGIFHVNGYRPVLSKLERYIPAGNAAQRGDVCMLEGAPWKTELESILRKINKDPRPIINDLGDCVSGLYDYIMSGWNSMLGS